MSAASEKGYTPMIRETLARNGYVGLDPLSVEEWMRVEHRTLDHLSAEAFAAEVQIAADCERVWPWPKHLR